MEESIWLRETVNRRPRHTEPAGTITPLQARLPSLSRSQTPLKIEHRRFRHVEAEFGEEVLSRPRSERTRVRNELRLGLWPRALPIGRLGDPVRGELDGRFA